MGFRSGAFATCWEVNGKSDTATDVRLSISRMNKQTGQYEQDFSGFVRFSGTGAATKALKLKPKDRIKLGDVDVSTFFNKEKGTTYTNFKCFSFEMANESAPNNKPENKADVDVDESEPSEGLPF